ncbi:DUF58 domain-containing protein [Gracilibacillus alcaliphilus]|uniref:DUF58 domain-containing protein n=1 Tax=Gracilibacillus alcaliphilus TaxID=1401441 RepID=UPI001EF857CA|nr:DUF58 domain-containing protein [Gracilibacillus alcaliphilus]MBM7677782.1 uncharacterized protein (DUF58 family) [Gracilibacillus alcaliphilus]
MTRLKNLWDRLLFRDKGILPTYRLVIYYSVFLIVLTIFSLWQFSWFFLGIATLAMLALLSIDAFMLPSKKHIQVSREPNGELERFEKQEMILHMANLTNTHYDLRFVDDSPQSFQASYLKQTLGANQAIQAHYTIQPHVRGNYQLNKVYLRVRTKWGLWEKQLTYSLPQEVKVIPNLSETRRYLENAQQYLLHEGIKVRKMRSGEGEFSKVRNYVVGDDPRNINWRQSAKLQELMTNEYEPEHGKYVTILIDCGRMMGVELEESNRLEKSIEAAITLATAALDNGDHVSVIAFSKEIKAAVPSGRGLGHIHTILDAIYDLQVDPQESNYTLALQHAQTLQRKRSMIILFSDMQSFANEDYPLFAMGKLRKKHLFVMLGIEDEWLKQQIASSPDNVLQAMEKSMAQKQSLFQREIANKWGSFGLPMLEAPADKLAVTSVSKYVETLNRGLL